MLINTITQNDKYVLLMYTITDMTVKGDLCLNIISVLEVVQTPSAEA